MAELDAWAWEVGYKVHYTSQSLQVLMEEGKQVRIGKPPYHLISGCFIAKGLTGAVVQRRRIRLTVAAIFAIIAILAIVIIVSIIVTDLASPAILPRLFTSYDANVE
ncbi:hypothetical protein BFJ63_vAg16603 [Fusarium oxysporum f. sp. narcissi]|uniref:Uncharacterized protein n=2 Tax=Fusarium oxysporum TaxID=5507 RepID=A0A4Q2V0V4_FUSOX|nr:hypothetical protein FOVG_17614 [Fusarium oxysporum f. sp. pisi HDV247]KAG6977996.1 hypothetical protein FocnCong_v021756 [Fusarium oxysporum f. sp. conglutinans]RYC80505.1 hypothetical protein BFJ63_vAg16603 [Fusarium oxysporum f. sp. narcissi]